MPTPLLPDHPGLVYAVAAAVAALFGGAWIGARKAREEIGAVAAEKLIPIITNTLVEHVKEYHDPIMALLGDIAKGQAAIEARLDERDKALDRMLDKVPCLNPENHRGCAVFPRFEP